MSTFTGAHFYKFSFILSNSLGKHSHRFLTHIPAGLLFLCAAVITLWLDMEWNKPHSFPAQLPLLYHSSSIQWPPPHTQLSIPLLSRWLFLAAALLFWNLLLTGCCWVSGRRSLLECLALSQTTPKSQRRADGSALWLQLLAGAGAHSSSRNTKVEQEEKKFLFPIPTLQRYFQVWQTFVSIHLRM